MKRGSLAPLARAWLEELNLLDHLADDATADERAEMLAHANRASEKVEEEFAALQAAGKLKELSRSYRLYRARCAEKSAKAVPWPAYAMGHKIRMVKALAREQAARARAGRSNQI